MPEGNDHLSGLMKRIVAYRTKQAVVRTHAAAQRKFDKELEKAVPSEREKKSLFEFFREHFLSLSTATALLMIGCFWFTSSTSVDLSYRPDPERTLTVSLPRNLRLDMKKKRMELFEGADRLTGRISPTNSTAGITAFAFALEGKDPTGTARLDGTLWLTNAPGRTVIKKKSDLTGALLRATLTFPGRLTNDVEAAFGPL